MVKNGNYVKDITEGVSKMLGDEYLVETKEVLKNNSVVLNGLMIRKKDEVIFPTIYLDDFYQEWLHVGTEAVVTKIIESYRKCNIPDVDVVTVFEDFEQVKENICYKLISKDRNETMLEDVPYIPYLNLAICFFYSFDDGMPGMGTVLIRNEHMKLWDTTVSELYSLAKKNTQRLMPAFFCSLTDMLVNLVDMEDELYECNDHVPMYVLTNSMKNMGASAILYDGILNRIYDTLQCNFYILPSSIHELIILPDKEDVSRSFLQNMVREINETALQTQEILSDEIYFYDRKAGYISLIILDEIAV